LKDYHVEFATNQPVDKEYENSLLSQIDKIDVTKINWEQHLKLFSIFKNVAFDTATSYGTYRLNHDPRDNSPDIEIASLSMGGEGVSVAGQWGKQPHTIIHSLTHAYLVAVVCKLKNIKPLESFDVSFEPSVLQNGPIWVISTHAERALQTKDLGADTVPERGYGLYSGDPDSRFDLAALDNRDSHLLSNADSAIKTAYKSAAWIRTVASELLKHDLVKDYCGLDK
jgi:hypothetical protein